MGERGREGGDFLVKSLTQSEVRERRGKQIDFPAENRGGAKCEVGERGGKGVERVIETGAEVEGEESRRETVNGLVIVIA